MICQKCGTQQSDQAAFCIVCGERLRKSSSSLIGYSQRIHDPALQAAMKKQKKATAVFALIVIPAPLIITLVISLFSDGLRTFPDAFLIGGGISLVFLLVNLLSLGKHAMERSWDGVVLYKQVENRRSDGADHTEYVIYVQTDHGEVKEIRESSVYQKYYHYLEVGNRIRYHPQFTHYYEKYDKSYDDFLYCPICAAKTPIEEEVCRRCGAPLLK